MNLEKINLYKICVVNQLGRLIQNVPVLASNIFEAKQIIKNKDSKWLLNQKQFLHEYEVFVRVIICQYISDVTDDKLHNGIVGLFIAKEKFNIKKYDCGFKYLASKWIKKMVFERLINNN